MFGFLKDKLKGALGKLSKEVEKDAVVEKKEVLVENKTKKPEDKKSTAVEEIKELPEPKKKGFFQKIFGKREEQEVIEDKEELRERAEKTFIEPKHKEKIVPKIKEPVRTAQEKPVNKEKPKEQEKKKEEIITHKEIIIPKIQEKETIAPKKIIEHKQPEKVEKEKIQEKVSEPVIQTIKPIIIEKIEVAKPVKEEKVPAAQPHYQMVEEKRQKKVVEHVEEEHKGFFTKITETFTKIQITEEKFEELFWDLEVVLLENNVAVEVIDKIKRDLKKELMAGKISRKGVEDMVISTLRQSITELFDVDKINLIEKVKENKKAGKPYIIAVIGVNGSGKTTSIAKLTHKLQKEGLSVVLAASDTFRAAAIQQLEEHANRLNVKLVKHDYNSDPAAVAFDAIKYAEAKKVDVVIIDTAGRLHSNTNLMRELEKVIRVCKPDIKIFVGESITGNDCVEQAKEFDKAVGIDAIILAKADVDDKGGAAISVSYILQRPILYLGTGQTYDDLKDFDSKLILESLEL